MDKKTFGLLGPDNVELEDEPKGQRQSLRSLNSIESVDQAEMEILRDVSFGPPGQGVFATYFIGYIFQAAVGD